MKHLIDTAAQYDEAKFEEFCSKINEGSKNKNNEPCPHPQNFHECIVLCNFGPDLSILLRPNE